MHLDVPALPEVGRDDPPLLRKVEVVPFLPGVLSVLGAEVPHHERPVARCTAGVVAGRPLSDFRPSGAGSKVPLSEERMH